MMKGWDYSDLSKAAKEYGGPEKFVDTIHEQGYQEGQGSMMPAVVLGIGCTFAGALTTGLLLYENHKLKKQNKAMKRERNIAVMKEYCRKAEESDSDEE